MLPIDLDKDLVDVKCVAVSTMISLQPSSVYSAKFYTPQANRSTADGDASLGEYIFDVSVTEIESIVEPDSIRSGIGREPVTIISIYRLIIPISAT